MLKMSDLPEEVQEKLKPLSRLDFECLEIEARRMRDEEAEAKLPTEPNEAMKGANDLLIEEVEVKVVSPREFVGSALEVAMFALSSKDFSLDEAEHLERVLSVARDVNDKNMNRAEEVCARLRAALKK